MLLDLIAGDREAACLKDLAAYRANGGKDWAGISLDRPAAKMSLGPAIDGLHSGPNAIICPHVGRFGR